MDWSLNQFRTQQTDGRFDHEADIFHHVYGLAHHQGSRAKFADNLERELRRISFASDFDAFATADAPLAGLQLDYETLEPYSLMWVETPGVPPLSYAVGKMKRSRDNTALVVNPSLTLVISPKTAQYQLANRSALEWVIGQYRISTDPRSGIISDPNRDDDPEYIVRLIGQVMRVRVETTQIVTAPRPISLMPPPPLEGVPPPPIVDTELLHD